MPDEARGTAVEAAPTTTLSRAQERLIPNALLIVSLTNALLTVEDLSADGGSTAWKLIPSTDDNDPCHLDKFEHESRIVKLTRDFSQGATGPFLTHTVSAFQSQASDAVWREAVTALIGCSEFSVRIADGSEVKFSASPVLFPRMGDDTVALRLTAKVPVLETLNVHAVYVRYGDVFLTLTHVSFGALGLDTSQTEAFVRKADAKMEALFP